LAPHNEDYVRQTIKGLVDLDIDHIVPMHCTGEPFYEILKAELPKKVIRSYTGRLDRTSLRVRIVPRLVRRSHGIPARGCPFSDHEQDRILVVVVRRNTRLPHRFARIWQALLDVASEHH
jgi:hypothetical protein